MGGGTSPINVDIVALLATAPFIWGFFFAMQAGHDGFSAQHGPFEIPKGSSGAVEPWVLRISTREKSAKVS